MNVAIAFGLVALCAMGAGKTAQTSHGNIEKEWTTFKIAHEKFYENHKEEFVRKNIFLENKSKIDKHNERYRNGEVTYSMKMNQFGDLAPHEFREMINGHKLILVNRSTLTEYSILKRKYNATELPDSVDWVSKGYVTAVKNQGHCGAGWAFSATGSVEGQVFKKTGRLVPLSEQNLIDCATEHGVTGCRGGGNVERGLEYIVDNGGIQDETSYPYEAKDDRTCDYDPSFSAATARGVVLVAPGDESLADAVAAHGPVSVSVSTLCADFQFYRGGVFGDARCPVTPDHGMLAVGYGADGAGQRYWTLKNSWGAGWGTDGYMRMSRATENTCGISDNPVCPVV